MDLCSHSFGLLLIENSVLQRLPMFSLGLAVQEHPLSFGLIAILHHTRCLEATGSWTLIFEREDYSQLQFPMVSKLSSTRARIRREHQSRSLERPTPMDGQLVSISLLLILQRSLSSTEGSKVCLIRETRASSLHLGSARVGH